MQAGGIRVCSFVSLDEFSLDGIEEHLPVFLDWVVAEIALDVASYLLQEYLANPINVLPQERADKPWRSRFPAKRIPEGENPDGLFIV